MRRLDLERQPFARIVSKTDCVAAQSSMEVNQLNRDLPHDRVTVHVLGRQLQT